MEFHLLGSLEVWKAGTQVPLGGPRQRAVLGALLFRANRLCSISYLTESVWERTPVSPAANLRTYISGLRRCLKGSRPDEASRILTRSGGYVLRVDPGELDLATFGELDTETTETSRNAELLGRGLALWRGEPLQELQVGPQLRIEIACLVDRRIEVAQRYAHLMAARGRHDRAVGSLRELVDSYPLREDLRAALLKALARAGRRAEALQEYRRTRELLIEELGIEPGLRLRQLHHSILTDQPDIKPLPEERRAAMVRVLARPHVRNLCGRSTNMAALAYDSTGNERESAV